MFRIPELEAVSWPPRRKSAKSPFKYPWFTLRHNSIRHGEGTYIYLYPPYTIVQMVPDMQCKPDANTSAQSYKYWYYSNTLHSLTPVIYVRNKIILVGMDRISGLFHIQDPAGHYVIFGYAGQFLYPVSRRILCNIRIRWPNFRLSKKLSSSKASFVKNM